MSNGKSGFIKPETAGFRFRSGSTACKMISPGSELTHVSFACDSGTSETASRLGEGIYELRIDFGPGFRIYFGQDGPRIVILLCAGDKSTQRKDIQRAKSHWIDFTKRKL